MVQFSNDKIRAEQEQNVDRFAVVAKVLQWNMLAEGLANDGFTVGGLDDVSNAEMSSYVSQQMQFKTDLNALEVKGDGFKAIEGNFTDDALKTYSKGLAECSDILAKAVPPAKSVEEAVTIEALGGCQALKKGLFLENVLKGTTVGDHVGGSLEAQEALLADMRAYYTLVMNAKMPIQREGDSAIDVGSLSQTALKGITKWAGRKDTVAKVILESGADFIAIEECDKVTMDDGILKLVSSKYSAGPDEGGVPSDYTFYYGNALRDTGSADEVLTKKIGEGWKEVGNEAQLKKANVAWANWLEATSRPDDIAFLPKFLANGLKLKPCYKEGASRDCHDDGVLILWDHTKYMLAGGGIRKFAFKTKANEWGDAGFVCAHVKTKESLAPAEFVFCGSHLSSGAAQESRVEEVTYMRTKLQELAAAHPKAALALAMDANIQNPLTQGGGDPYGVEMEDAEGKVKGNEEVPDGRKVLDALVEGSNLQLYTNPKAGCSVNKMRSAYTNQPRKAGEYEMHNIDWVLSKAPLESSYSLHPVVDASSLQMATSKLAAFGNILPSRSIPSDHMPVLVELHKVAPAG